MIYSFTDDARYLHTGVQSREVGQGK